MGKGRIDQHYRCHKEYCVGDDPDTEVCTESYTGDAIERMSYFAGHGIDLSNRAVAFVIRVEWYTYLTANVQIDYGFHSPTGASSGALIMNVIPYGE